MTMDPLQAYRESEITSDNPIHLVVLLYDQLLRDLQRALDAFAAQDVPRRCREMDHALVVLGQLQGTVNLDRGGEVARTLDHFYSVVRNNVLLAASQGSPDLLKKQREQIQSVREAWLEVERQQAPFSLHPASPSSDGNSVNPDTQENSEWKA